MFQLQTTLPKYLIKTSSLKNSNQIRNWLFKTPHTHFFSSLSSKMRAITFEKVSFLFGYHYAILGQQLSEQLYKSGRIRPTLWTGQISNLSKNQCYIFRWTLWHIKFGAKSKTEALGVISSFRGWISLYRASRQNVLFFSRYAE